MRLDQLLELLDLARADVGGDVDLMPLLKHPPGDDQAGGLGQPPDLFQGVVGRILSVGQEDLDQDRLFAAISALGALSFDQSGRHPR